MECTQSFNVRLAECPDTIRVYANLKPSTDYAWQIVDKHGNEYYEIVTTNSSGNFEIDCTADYFPAGLFNRHAGTFTLQVYEYYSQYYYSSEALDIVFCDEEYNAILITFVKRSTSLDSLIQYIKCGPDGGSGNGGQLDHLLWT